MEANGVRPEQVAQVRGYADRQLRHPEDPTAASNRRISVIVQYLPPATDARSGAAAAPGASGASQRPRRARPGNQLLSPQRRSLPNAPRDAQMHWGVRKEAFRGRRIGRMAGLKASPTSAARGWPHGPPRSGARRAYFASRCSRTRTGRAAASVTSASGRRMRAISLFRSASHSAGAGFPAAR